MKSIYFLLVVGLFCSNVFSQSIVGVNKKEKVKDLVDVLISKKWVAKKLVGENRNISTYQLEPYNDKYSYGNALIFKDSIHFTSYYFAFCGLDCFRKVNGQYKRINKTTIELFINSVSYSGTCAKPTMYMYDEKYKNLGKFKISNDQAGGLVLTKK